MGNLKSMWFNRENSPKTANGETSSSRSSAIDMKSLMSEETVNGVKTVSKEVENTEKDNGEASIKRTRKKRKKKKLATSFILNPHDNIADTKIANCGLQDAPSSEEVLVQSHVNDGQLMDTNILRSLSQEEVENSGKANSEALRKRKRKNRKKKKTATSVVLNPPNNTEDTEIANSGQQDTPSTEELPVQSQVNDGILMDTNIVRSYFQEVVENTGKATSVAPIKRKRKIRKKKKLAKSVILNSHDGIEDTAIANCGQQDTPSSEELRIQSHVYDGQLMDTNVIRSFSKEEVENTKKANGEASIKRERMERKKKKQATSVFSIPHDNIADTEIANCGQHDTPSCEELPVQSQVKGGQLIDTNIVRSLSEEEIKDNGEASIKRKRKRRKKKKPATIVIQNPQDTPSSEDPPVQSQVNDGQLIDTKIFRSLSGKLTIGNVKVLNGKDFATRSKKKLLILDVNGLLGDVIHPPPKDCKPDIKISRRAIFKRPFLDDFLGFCFKKFDVAIWSSRTRKILDPVVDYLLGDLKKKLVFLWDLSHCTNSRARSLENYHKFIVFKKLGKIWERKGLIASKNRYYDESNTLLLDDSPYKALLNPKHTGIFPLSYTHKDTNDNSLGPDGDLRVYLEGVAASENVKTYVEQHPFGQRAIDETSPDWAYYSKALRNVF